MSTATKPPTTPPAQGRPGQRNVVATPNRDGRIHSLISVRYDENGFPINELRRQELTPQEEAKRRAKYNDDLAQSRQAMTSDNAIRLIRLRSSRSVPTLDCQPTAIGGGKTTGQRNWLCGLNRYIKFEEQNWSVQENEYRVFIEGSEVSNYLEGSLSWTTESTGGINTCRFTLNNTQDAFIVSPVNICAGPDKQDGWRLTGAGGSMDREHWRVDETAKQDIYRKKYNAVAPEKEGTQQIDPDTGMWLYPLNPFSCIFNKHDVVRIAIKLPHRGGQNPVLRTDKSVDMWMFVFTGFIKDYSWSDNPVEGHRTVNITAYDYRGLMERMRVRIFAGRTSDGTNNFDTTKGGSKGNTTTAAQQDTARMEADLSKMPWLDCAIMVGKQTEERVANLFTGFKSMWPGVTINPYLYANKLLYFKNTFADLHSVMFYHGLRLGVGGDSKWRVTGNAACGANKDARVGDVNTARGEFALSTKDFNAQCSARVLTSINRTVSREACEFTRLLGSIIEHLVTVYELTGENYVVFYGTTTQTNAASSIKGKRLLTCTLKQQTSKQNENSIVSILEQVNKGYDSIADQLVTAAIRAYASEALIKGLDAVGARKLDTSTTTGQRDTSADLVNVQDLAAAAEARVTLDAQKSSALGNINANEHAIRSRLFARNATLGSQNQQQADETRITKLQKEIQQLRDENSKLVAVQISDPTKRSELQTTINDNNRSIKSREQLLMVATAENTNAIIGKGGAVQQLNQVFAQFLRKTFYQAVLESLTSVGEVLASGGIAGSDEAATTLNSIVASTDVAITRMRNVYRGMIKTIQADIKNLILNTKQTSALSLTRANILVTGEDTPAIRGISTLAALAQTRERLRTSSSGSIGLSTILNVVDKEITRLIGALPQQLPQEQLVRFLGDMRGIAQRIGKLRSDGSDRQLRSQSMGEQFVKHANFEVKHAGIFADLISTIKDQPHPLANKSFEHSIEILCCDQQKIIPGVKETISDYRADEKKLSDWNRMVLFGVVGRPLTYGEVSHIGKNSVSDLQNTYSPYNVFYHMLAPASGTGASTIIQMNTGQVGINSTTLNYSTRKALLDEICSVLDYQFFVSGWGDLIFELPHYNAFPQDFGILFKGAYTIAREWTQVTISEESKDIPTAWVLTGLASEEKLGEAEGRSDAVKNVLAVKVMMATVLARRLGVKVENVNIKIPGVGTSTDQGSTKEQAQDQLEVYGLFHIQKTLGAAHMLQIGMMFRPYIIPNRPIYFIPRQRIGLVQSVTHTLNFPNGACTTDCTMGQVRFLFRDGTFRYMSGGQHLPIDYVGFHTGVPAKDVREGSGTPRGSSSVSCTSDLSERAREANAFSTAVAHQWGTGFKSNFRVVRPSAPRTTAVMLQGSGLRATSNTETRPSVAADSPSPAQNANSDPLTLVNQSNPWQYSAPQPPPGTDSGWGYFRRFRPYAGGYQDTARQFFKRNVKDYEHDGWDLGLANGRAVLAPVDIYYATARLNVGPWAGVSRYAYVLSTEKGAEQFKVNANAAAESIEGKKWLRIYGEQYLLWKQLGGSNSGIKVVRRHSGGLILRATGYVNFPKVNQEGKIKAVLGYVHLHTLRTVQTGETQKTIGGTSKGGKDSRFPLVKAGEVIAYGGSSGAVAPHLHFCLWLQPNESIFGRAQSDADKAQAKTALAANKEFVDAQLRAMAEFYKMDRGGNDPRSKFKDVNSPAADYWQAYAYKFKKKRGQVTIDDVVKAFQKKMRYKEFVPDDISSAKLVKVNPTFFFSREQLIGGRTMRYMDRYGTGNSAVRAMAEDLYKKSSVTNTAKISACVAVSKELDQVIDVHNKKCERLREGMQYAIGPSRPYAEANLKKCLDAAQNFNTWKGTCKQVADVHNKRRTFDAKLCLYRNTLVARAVEEKLRKSTQESMDRGTNRTSGMTFFKTSLR